MKKQLQELISQGKTNKAIQGLLEYSEQKNNDELREEVLIQSSRFELYSKEKRQGTSSLRELNTSIAKINQSLLYLINQIPDEILPLNDEEVEDHNIHPPNKPQESGKRFNWKQFFLAASAFLGILAGIAEFSGYSLRDFFSNTSTISSNTVLVKVISVYFPPKLNHDR